MSTTSRKATVYFDPVLHDALRERAASGGSSISALVNDAVRAYLEGRALPPNGTPPEAVATKEEAPASAKKKKAAKPEKTIPFKRFVKKLKARGKL